MSDSSPAHSARSHTIALTGGTGFVGRHLIAELLSQGHSVRFLVRDPADAAEIRRTYSNAADRLVAIPGDISDEAALDRLCEGAETLIHLIGIIREAPQGQTFRNMHIGATKRALATAKRNNIRRYLHMSALGVRLDSKAAYGRTKAQAEQLVLDSSLDWTIFRPSLIHGPDSELVHMVKDFATADVPPYMFMPYFARPEEDTSVPFGPVNWTSAQIQPIYVGDVAKAFADSLNKPDTIGEIYNLTGPTTLTWPELYRQIRDTVPGTRKHINPWLIPGTHGILLARVATFLGLGHLLPYNEGQVYMAMQDSTAEHHKAATDLGLDPMAFLPALETYAASV